MKKKSKKFLFAGTILFICINIVIKLFFIDIVKIQGYSMYPSFKNGSYVLVSKFSTGMRCPRSVFEIPWINTIAYYLLPNKFIDNELLKTPKSYHRIKNAQINRNDVVIFNLPYYLSSTAIKRCIGMPGDSIIHFSKNNHILSIIPYKGMRIRKELYNQQQQERLKNKFYFISDEITNELVATTNFYFVQGDNISGSIDSRTWGLLPEDHIIAKVLFAIF